MKPKTYKGKKRQGRILEDKQFLPKAIPNKDKRPSKYPKQELEDLIKGEENDS